MTAPDSDWYRVPVDWRLVSDALDHYTTLGYQNVTDAPWAVDVEASSATRSENRAPFPLVHGRELVGSAEQGFVQMMLDGWSVETAVAAGPCFRRELVNDRVHRPYFFKVELIRPFGREHVDWMVSDALSLLRAIGVEGLVVVPGDGVGSRDIVTRSSHGELELGSYGMRVVRVGDRTLAWSYGTGLAEPRVSMALGQ